MEIKEIVIQTDDLKGTENFYANVLGFELIKKEQSLTKRRTLKASKKK